MKGYTLDNQNPNMKHPMAEIIKAAIPMPMPRQQYARVT
jgi:hypothetical protein